MKDFMKVLLVQPQLPARAVLIENSSEALRAMVNAKDTLRTEIPWQDSVAVIFNPAVPHSEKTLNRVIESEQDSSRFFIAGDFLIVGISESGSLRGLSESESRKYQMRFLFPDRFKKILGGYSVFHTRLDSRDNTDQAEGTPNN